MQKLHGEKLSLFQCTCTKIQFVRIAEKYVELLRKIDGFRSDKHNFLLMQEILKYLVKTQHTFQ